MKQFIYLLTVISILSLTSMTFADDIPTGSYRNTCMDIHLAPYIGGRILTATCLRRNLPLFSETQYITAGDVPNGWLNKHGNLYRRRSVPSGSWLKSCVGSSYNSISQKLTAHCKNSDNKYIETSIEVPPTAHVWNKNGVLTRH